MVVLRPLIHFLSSQCRTKKKLKGRNDAVGIIGDAAVLGAATMPPTAFAQQRPGRDQGCSFALGAFIAWRTQRLHRVSVGVPLRPSATHWRHER